MHEALITLRQRRGFQPRAAPTGSRLARRASDSGAIEERWCGAAERASPRRGAPKRGAGRAPRVAWGGPGRPDPPGGGGGGRGLSSRGGHAAGLGAAGGAARGREHLPTGRCGAVRGGAPLGRALPHAERTAEGSEEELGPAVHQRELSSHSQGSRAL